LSAVVLTFIDYQLQIFTPKIPSYILNASDLLDQIDAINTVPPGARLFTSDTTSMYTNIDPDEGIPILQKYLETYKDEIPNNKVNIPFTI
jgi:hypothetical protein